METLEKQYERDVGIVSSAVLGSKEPMLPTFLPTDAEAVREMTLEQRKARAIKLLQDNEPEDGYYLAFSGGKDSCAIKHLSKLSGVKFEAWYNQTTIDPPELVRFIKQHHSDTKWNLPKYGNMMSRVATKPAMPPTRSMRWCCDEYKEGGGHGRTKIFGVRASESAARKNRWREVAADAYKNPAICPIVYWTDEQVWELIKTDGVPYCALYDEGWTRLGCVGCPLNNTSRIREFERWPAFERNWKKAIVANWEKYHALPRKDGKPRYHSKFKSGEELWKWWMQEMTPDAMREDCQSMVLWTNEQSGDDALLPNK